MFETTLNSWFWVGQVVACSQERSAAVVSKLSFRWNQILLSTKIYRENFGFENWDSIRWLKDPERNSAFDAKQTKYKKHSKENLDLNNKKVGNNNSVLGFSDGFRKVSGAFLSNMFQQLRFLSDSFAFLNPHTSFHKKKGGNGN